MWERENHKDYNIAIYARESRDDNEESYETIETQRDLLIDFIEKNKFGKIYNVYIDNNVSGTGFERNGLSQMEEDIRNGRINLLILKDLSRLGRNNAKTLLFLDFLEEYGVRVITFDGRYDSFRDNDTVGIDTWYNERYVRDISRKIRANLRFKIQKGEYIGRAPYGYVKSNKKKNKLEIDPGSAAVVKKIFSLYLDGYGYAYIANFLNNKGYLSPSSRQGVINASKEWNAVAVQRILSNRVYIGDTVQGISEKISFKSKKTRRLPSDRWVITTNTHLPIVTKEEFESVQKKREAKKSHTEPHKGRLHVFKGLIRCGACGSTMFARVRKNRPMGYICGTYARKGKTECSSHYINEESLTAIVLNELRMMFNNKKLRENIVEKLKLEFIEENDSVKEIERLSQQLLVKQRQQDTLYLDRLDEKISEELFVRMNTSLERSINIIKQEINEYEHRNNSIDGFETIIDKMLKDIANTGLRHELASILVDKITVFDENDDTNCLIDEFCGENNIRGTQGHGMVVIDFKYKDWK